MAGTLADSPWPMRAVVGPSLAQSAQPQDDEADEPPVVAEPRLDRSVFLYLEPRDGIDGLKYFGSCGSCQNYISEADMHGAVMGSRCKLFGTFQIGPEDSCGLYAPWPMGRPYGQGLGPVADAAIAAGRAAVLPSQVGYISKTPVQCMHCRQFEADENECSFFECLNAALPDIFALDKAVVPHGCCNAFSAIPVP